jgi:cytochrome c biogenesis protein CcmG, thiol:disulfide interchange protein DsbE
MGHAVRSASFLARMIRRLLLTAAVLVPTMAVLGLLAWGFTREAKFISTPLLARPAPAFSLTLFDGAGLRLEELRGKVVFLNFWASWCPPCRAEARMLEASWRGFKGRGVVFLGINIQDKDEAAREFLREFDVTYPNGMDPGSKIAIDYGVWGLPETFIIDREGRITYKHVGALGAETVIAKLDEALQGIVSTSEGRGEFQSVQR